MKDRSINPLVPFDNPITMTSLEIADLVESRHDKVKQSIERLAEKGIIQLPPTGIIEKINSLGLPQKTKVYVFSGEQGKRDSIVVVAQLSPGFTARLVDRWIELESSLLDSPPEVPVQPRSKALEIIQDGLILAKLLGVPEHYAQSETIKEARRLTQVDYSPLLKYAPAQDNIQADEVLLEPTELAQKFGLSSGAKMNRVLAELGLQVRHNGEWQPTEKGARYCVRHHWIAQNKDGYNLKWRYHDIADMIND